jgi:protein-disulfide isomerase-like protein with CxxC motif
MSWFCFVREWNAADFSNRQYEQAWVEFSRRSCKRTKATSYPTVALAKRKREIRLI